MTKQQAQLCYHSSYRIVSFMMLFPLFLVLKKFGVIDWSWWWVTSPLWLPMLVLLVFVLIPIFMFATLAILALVSIVMAKLLER